MPLAALLFAGEPPEWRVVGTDPVELQLRRVREAGVGHAVIFAERVTSALITVVDRLRREGLSVDVARSAADVAEYIHPDQQVLMITPDIFVTSKRLKAVATGPQPTLLCVRDEPSNEDFERIDATARWTGFALIDGGGLRRTATMVGDWDLAATLMRRAVQDGAARITLSPGEAATDLIVARDPAGARLAGRRLTSTDTNSSDGLVTRWLITPLARHLVRATGDLGVPVRSLTMAAVVVFGVAAICGLMGWVVASLALMLVGLVVDSGAAVGAAAGATARQSERLWATVRFASALLIYVAMGMTLTLRTAQWGCVVLSLVVVGATWLATPVMRDGTAPSRWQSEPGSYAIVGLIGFAVGAPLVAVALSAAHAVIGLFWAVRKASVGLARP